MHQNDQDSSWTTKDSYDDVPAFKELFERLESDDRDFLAPHPTTGTAVDALTRGGKSETNLKIVNMITDVEDGVDLAGRRLAHAEQDDLLAELGLRELSLVLPARLRPVGDHRTRLDAPLEEGVELFIRRTRPRSAIITAKHYTSS